MGPPLLDKQSEIELSAIGNGQHQLVSDVIGNGQHQLVSSDVDARLADIEMMLKQLLAKREHAEPTADEESTGAQLPELTGAQLPEALKREEGAREISSPLDGIIPRNRCTRFRCAQCLSQNAFLERLICLMQKFCFECVADEG